MFSFVTTAGPFWCAHTHPEPSIRQIVVTLSHPAEAARSPQVHTPTRVRLGMGGGKRKATQQKKPDGERYHSHRELAANQKLHQLLVASHLRQPSFFSAPFLPFVCPAAAPSTRPVAPPMCQNYKHSQRLPLPPSPLPLKYPSFHYPTYEGASPLGRRSQKYHKKTQKKPIHVARIVRMYLPRIHTNSTQTKHSISTHTHTATRTHPVLFSPLSHYPPSHNR